ncbi:multiple inositol polyphosphate phosphatase 1-like [Amyelois transitella]|uniref:multiple inositol polyphosphate phosphatase 1-like n=1 Tax=Amyelois transitella TaxID=680683 RepID=UPI00067CE200|nr:multiple inositol polyphosphate phosphatase 1-like [Amyelois transitella]
MLFSIQKFTDIVTMFTRLFLVTISVTTVLCGQCYWNSTPYKYFGGKTLYDDVRGDIRNVTELHGCQPISLWLLSRHGSRNPGEANIRHIKDAMRIRDDILTSHSQGRGELCDQDIADLEAWRWNDTIDATPYFLTSRGYRELREMAGRINDTFYTLLKNLPVHYIRSTDEQRTIESAKGFLSGLDTRLGYKILEPLEKDKDLILLPYKNCEVHLKEAWNGPRRQLELNKYFDSSDFKQLSDNLQKRTGLREPVSTSNISGLYDLCRFHRSFSETARSPWCALFSKEDLEVLEYTEDIRHYFRSGYGLHFNIKLGELALEDMLQKFNAAVFDSQPSFTAYISHDSLMDMVFSALGLFRDEEGVSAAKRDPMRKWRSSFNTPFAANILAVLYRCIDLENTNHYKVQFFVNERPVNVCEELACSWSEYQDKFRPFLNSSLNFCTIK